MSNSEIVFRAVDNFKCPYYEKGDEFKLSGNALLLKLKHEKTFVSTAVITPPYEKEGSCDSAIGMSIVLAIANYSRELERLGISPKYDMKFIGFGGEEAGVRGA